MPADLTLKRRPPESRSAQQQKYIAGIVYDLIAEKGIENVTMRQVAEAAKISLGTITYHFQTKESLIAAALESGYELPDDWDQYKGSPIAQLRRVALFYALQSPNSRWWGFWINCVAMSTRNPEIQAQQAKRFDRQREFWIKLIDEGKAAQEVRADSPTEETVDQMLVEVHGLMMLQMVKPTSKMRTTARKAINAMIDRHLL
ncbi:MAG TPA: TetR/AcrR family transcriptional regulator [Pseudolabrys sp.]|nr:TetR/AcrR family transcriptional regulator [Pseudolabrys sp.]